MDEGPRKNPGDRIVVTGLGGAGPDCDPRPFLKVRKSLKFMGTQDRLAVAAAGAALDSAGLRDSGLGERAGLYLAVGYIPFEKADVDLIDAAFYVHRFRGRRSKADVPVSLQHAGLPHLGEL